MLKKLISRRWLLPSILVLVGVIVLGSLGVWQVRRLGERRAHNADIQARLAMPVIELTDALADPAALNYRHVRVHGTFDPGQEIVLRNQALHDEPGVHLLTPLRLAGRDEAVLIDRGWIPYDKPRSQYPVQGEATIEGIARMTQTRQGWLSPQDPQATAAGPRVESWYRVDTARIQPQVPYPLLPLFVQQTSGFVDGAMPAADVQIDLSDGPHLSYAIQWFAFATILLVGYAAYVRSRGAEA